MPPRFAYWTIILDDAPTAFRARDRADLLPTLRQLITRNPNATIKWFAHGKLWESPEEARAAFQRGKRDEAERARRSPDWRPGGRHEDPRAKFRKGAAGSGRAGRAPGGAGTAGRAGWAAKEGAARREASSGDRPHGGQSRPRPTGSRRTDRDRAPGMTGDSRTRGGYQGAGRPRKNKKHHAAPPRGAERQTTDIPEPEPPAPAPPPGPDRPPKPGQEPGPETPDAETIRILPEPPERAKGAPKPKA